MAGKILIARFLSPRGSVGESGLASEKLALATHEHDERDRQVENAAIFFVTRSKTGSGWCRGGSAR